MPVGRVSELSSNRTHTEPEPGASFKDIHI